MATVVNDLVTKFSFVGSPSPLDGYNGMLGSSIKLLGGMLAALNAAAAGFAYWADGVLTGVDSLDALSKQTKVAVADIQTLNYMAEQTQSSAGAMESSLRSLSATIGSAAQKGSEDFARLGISVRDANGNIKSSDVVLDEVRQRFRALGLSMQEQEHFASALGIDASLLQLLNKTNSEMAGMRDRAQELGTLTAEQTKQAAEYKKSLNSMWFGLNSVKQLVAVGMAPEMGRLADAFTQLLIDNKDWIVDGIKATVSFIGDLLAAFNRLLPVFGLLVAGFLASKVAALGFAGVMGIVTSPIVLITAGVTALLFIIDDLIVAFRGGQSVIADFFQEFLGVDIVPIMQGIVDAVVAGFERLKAIGASLFDFFGGVFGGIGDLLSGNFEEGIQKIWDSFLNLGQSLYDNLFGPLFDRIKNLALSILPDWALKLIGGDSSEPKSMPAEQATIPSWASGSDAVNAARVDNRSVQQNIDIRVANSDPDAAGRAVADNLQRQLDDANTQLSPGGR